MVNRIKKFGFKPLAPQERKTVTDEIKGRPKKCSFCGEDTEDTQSIVNALSKQTIDLAAHPAMICSHCIENLNRLVQFSKIYQKYIYNEDCWTEISVKMHSRLFAVPSSPAERMTVVDLTIELLKRACRLASGESCPTSTFIIDGRPGNLEELLSITAEMVGLPFCSCTMEEIENNKAKDNILGLMYLDQLLSKTGVVFVKNGVLDAELLSPCAVVSVRN